MTKWTIGWDVGGAHLKAALLDEAGQLLHALQVQCPLWRGLSFLDTAIEDALQMLQDQQIALNAQVTAHNLHHYITMTGELVDLFAHRQQGVAEISARLQAVLTGEKYFYVMQSYTAKTPAFITFDHVHWHWQQIASANWHASASLLGQYTPQALLIDIGSTTSDFSLIHEHQVRTDAYTDAQRMQAQSLIYTGVVRTPVMALGHSVMFEGKTTPIAAEHFATTADVYRLTGDLTESDDMADTADNAAKTIDASAKRLARMIGHDSIDANLSDWKALAAAFKAQQLARLTQVAEMHLNAADMPQTTVILGAGAGHFLVEAIAKQLRRPYQTVSSVLQAHLTAVHMNNATLQHDANVALPAVAVAYLGYNAFNHA